MEESLSVIIGYRTSREVWQALSTAYSHHSKARELSLKDDLLNTKRGSRSVSEYGNQFKAVCDQLAAIGRPVDDTDKVHWFLRGLGPSFSTFTAAQLSQEPLPLFPVLLSRALSHELFQKAMDNQAPSLAAFTASRGRGRSSSPCGRSGPNNGRGCGRGRRKFTPHYFFCRETDHDVFDCPRCFDRSYDRSSRPAYNANLAEAFSAGCSISDNINNTSDWFFGYRRLCTYDSGRWSSRFIHILLWFRPYDGRQCFEYKIGTQVGSSQQASVIMACTGFTLLLKLYLRSCKIRSFMHLLVYGIPALVMSIILLFPF